MAMTRREKVPGLVRRAVALIVAALLLAGCATTHLRILHQRTPNPLRGARDFVLEPMDFQNALVGTIPMAALVRMLPANDQLAWSAGQPRLFPVLVETFTTSTAGTYSVPTSAPAPGSFVLHTEMVELRLGFGSGGLAGSTTTATATVRLTVSGADGELIDQVEIITPRVTVDNMGTTNYLAMFPALGIELAEGIAHYLRSRTDTTPFH